MAGYGAKGISRVGAYRSGLEAQNMKVLEANGVKAEYEMWRIPYVIPASNHVYTPDVVLPNGIIVELKGLWDSDDRKKHLLIREQYPEIKVRLVFSSSKAKLYKGSKTTYGEWCTKHGIIYADKLIPASWIKEPKQDIPWDKLVRKKEK